ncbi:sugar ABC transporter ATP-binding protein [Candidatus Poriferisodalis sp.]|uniref:sugar ABC transporter ATP-binding protein n=1 Tax=Candidatus Poriferisodalis sp. TaxID=3101277 RepID=UPI003B01A310
MEALGTDEAGSATSLAFLRAVGLTKTFGGVRCVDSADVSFCSGQIHGLVGQNGAGKTTLAKMLCGALSPDGGHIEADGAPTSFGSPRDALDAGVTMVAQELSLVPELSVAENLSLGQLPSHLGVCSTGELMRRAQQHIDDSGFDLDPAATVSALAQSDRQKAEILRAVARNARMVIFDEPRSSLSVNEAAHVYAVMRGLAANGVAVVLISHFLSEVLEVCDVVTVMRDGRVVTSAPTADLSARDLVEQMIGASHDGTQHKRPSPPPPIQGSLRFEARGLTGRGFDNISLTVGVGEIVAIVGLVGSGRSEFLSAVYGVQRPSSGSILIDGIPRRIRNPRASKRAGLAYISESRQADGVFPLLGVDTNITVAHMGTISRWGVLQHGRQRERSSDAAQRVNVRAERLSQPISSLSGGNQQKSLLARWLVEPPQLLLIDEPTRGVDVVSTAQIHEVVIRLAETGMSVLMVTSDFDEALAIAHRIYVFRDGCVVGEFDGDATDESTLVGAAFAADTARPAGRI